MLEAINRIIENANKKFKIISKCAFNNEQN